MVRLWTLFHARGLIRDWKKNLNNDIDFWRVPVTWNPPAKEHAKLFYAAEALGMEEIIGSAFTSIHLDRKFLTSEREITELSALLELNLTSIKLSVIHFE